MYLVTIMEIYRQVRQEKRLSRTRLKRYFLIAPDDGGSFDLNVEVDQTLAVGSIKTERGDFSDPRSCASSQSRDAVGLVGKGVECREFSKKK